MVGFARNSIQLATIPPDGWLQAFSHSRKSTRSASQPAEAEFGALMKMLIIGSEKGAFRASVRGGVWPARWPWRPDAAGHGPLGAETQVARLWRKMLELRTTNDPNCGCTGQHSVTGWTGKNPNPGMAGPGRRNQSASFNKSFTPLQWERHSAGQGPVRQPKTTLDDR